MVSVPKVAALALATAVLFTPAARAECRDAGAACPSSLSALPVSAMGLVPSDSVAAPQAQVGDVVPRGRYSIILNADYYGLPPVSDGWVYMRIGLEAYRVDWRTHQILERVTDRVAANF